MSQLRALWQQFRRSAWQLLLYAAFFQLLSVALLSPASSWLATQLISTSGRLVLSNEDILRFLLTPTGAGSMLVLVSLSLALGLAQQAGMILIVSGAARKLPISAFGALIKVGRRTPSLAGLGLYLGTIYALVAMPFAVIAWLVYRALLSEADINYYAQTRPPEFWQAVSIGGLLALLLFLAGSALYLRFALALPVCLNEARAPRATLRESWQLARGRLWMMTGWLGLWLLISFVGSILVAISLDAFSDLTLRLVGDRRALVVPAVGILWLLALAAAALTAFGGQSLHALVLVKLYRRARHLPEITSETFDDVDDTDDEDEAQGNRRSGLLWTGAAIAAATAIGFSMVVVESLDLDDNLQITAHRGSSMEAPENSLSAFRQAIRDGADYAELDVQETSDGVLVVLHDSDLRRIAGVPKSIWELSYAEVQQLETGSAFSAEFAGEKIPTLAEVIDLAGDRIKLNIELKYNGHDQQLAQRVVQLVQQRRFVDRCVITSLDYNGIREAKGLDPNLRVGLIVFQSLGDLSRVEADFLSVSQSLATEQLIGRAHRNGMQIHVWTVNEAEDFDRLADLGVDNIITDRPRLMRELLDKRASQSDVERIVDRFWTLLRN